MPTGRCPSPAANTDLGAARPQDRPDGDTEDHEHVGDASGGIYPNGSATTGYFEYGTTPDFGTQVAFPGLKAKSGPRSRYRSISGLTPGTTYYFRVVATNTVGTTYMETRTFTTSTG